MEIEKGFYYHCKHDPAKGIYDAAYEYLGNAFDAESGRAELAKMRDSMYT